MSPSKFIKGWETLSCGGLDEYIYISLFCNKTLLSFSHSFYYNNEKYIFYYEVLLGQSRTINGPSDFHQKEKMKKRKNIPKNIESFPPHPPGGGQHLL
jgi:hypothetical protein